MAEIPDPRLVQIRSLLKLTAGLINMYYDCDIVTRDIAADDPFDVEQLGEVRHVLETLLEATKTDGAHPPGTMLPVDVSKLFSKCEDNISRMEASLKRRSGQKRVKGPSSSNPQEILTSLASSAVDLTGGNQQPSTGTSVGNSVTYIDCDIDYSSSKTYHIKGDQIVYNDSAAKDADQQTIRRWLSAPDTSSNHNDAVNKRRPETGLWLFNGEPLKNWKDTAPSFAWFHGIPGCGKTVLCSAIIEDVTNHCNLKENTDFALAYFYFDFTSDAKRKTSSCLIRSFLTQLSFQLHKRPDELLELYEKCQHGSQQAPTADLMKVLKSIIGKFQHVYFIIDALDECSEWENLLGVLTEIADWKLPNLHVLATSRRERCIEERLTRVVSSHMNLDSDLVDEDIRHYLKVILVEDTRFKGWTERDRRKTEDTLVEGAHGMFSWVVCQLGALAGSTDSPFELREALHSLPPTLEETYDRILRMIPTRPRDKVVKLLRWLAFSARPLALVELAEVFAIHQDEFDSERRPRDPRRILDTCSSLVKISNSTLRNDDYGNPLRRLPASVLESGTLALIHLSVKEYLISEELRDSKSSSSCYYLDKKLADSIISRECLAYLLQFDTVDSLREQSEASISFGRYAAEFWITHARSDDGVIEDAVQPLISRLLSPQGASFNNWVKLFDVDRSYGQESSNNIPCPLYYASLLGLGQIVDQLVSGSELVDVNLMGGKHGSALASASYGGYKDIVGILLKNGANVNTTGGEYGSALASASAGGQKEIVEILLEKGADVNMVGGEYGSPLASASARGHKDIVKILLAKGANVNCLVEATRAH